MKIESLFCMKGCGYLQGVTQQSDHFVAQIRIVNNPEQVTKSDCVLLDLTVEDKTYQRLLVSLLTSVQQGHSVILHFESEYLMLVNATSGQTSEDPQHIVQLEANLLKLEKCFIGGQRALVSKPIQLAV